MNFNFGIFDQRYRIQYNILKRDLANDIRYKLLGCFFHTELNNILTKSFDFTSRINKSTHFKYSIRGNIRMKYFLHNQIQSLPLSIRMKFILLKNKDPFFNSFDIANPKLAMNKTTNKLSIDTKGSFSIFQYRVNSSLPSNTSLTVGNPLLFLETEYNKFRGSLFNHSFIDKPRRLFKQDISFPEMRKLPILYKYIPDYFWDLDINLSFLIKQKLYDFTMYSQVNNNLSNIKIYFFKKTNILFTALNNFIGPEESVMFGKTQNLKFINKIIYKFFYYTDLIKLPYGGNIETNNLLENRSIHTSYLESKLRKTDIMFPYYNKDEYYMNMVISSKEHEHLNAYDLSNDLKYVPGKNRNEFFDYVVRNNVLSMSGDYGSKYIYNGYSKKRNFPFTLRIFPFISCDNRILSSTYSKLDYLAVGDKRFVHRIPLNAFKSRRLITKYFSRDSLGIYEKNFTKEIGFRPRRLSRKGDVPLVIASDDLSKIRRFPYRARELDNNMSLYLLKSGSENDNLRKAFINNNKDYFCLSDDFSQSLLKSYLDPFFNLNLPNNKYLRELIGLMEFFNIRDNYFNSYTTTNNGEIRKGFNNRNNIETLFLHSNFDVPNYINKVIKKKEEEILRIIKEKVSKNEILNRREQRIFNEILRTEKLSKEEMLSTIRKKIQNNEPFNLIEQKVLNEILTINLGRQMLVSRKEMLSVDRVKDKFYFKMDFDEGDQSLLREILSPGKKRTPYMTGKKFIDKYESLKTLEPQIDENETISIGKIKLNKKEISNTIKEKVNKNEILSSIEEKALNKILMTSIGKEKINKDEIFYLSEMKLFNKMNFPKLETSAKSGKKMRLFNRIHRFESRKTRHDFYVYRNKLYQKWLRSGVEKLRGKIFYREEELEPYTNKRMIGGDRVRKYCFKKSSNILKLEKENKRPKLMMNYHFKNDRNLFDSYKMNSFYEYNKTNNSFLPNFLYFPFYGIDQTIRNRNEIYDAICYNYIKFGWNRNTPVLGKKKYYDTDHIFKNFVFSFKYFLGPKTSSTIKINNYRTNIKNNLYISENKSYKNTNIINNYLPFYNYSIDIIHKGFDILKLDMNIQIYLFGFNINPFIIIYLLIFSIFLFFIFIFFKIIKNIFNKDIYHLSSNYKKEIIHNMNNKFFNSRENNNLGYAYYKNKLFYKRSAHKEKEKWNNKYIDPIISFFYFFISVYVFVHFLKDVYFAFFNFVVNYFIEKVDFFLMSYKGSALHIINHNIYDLIIKNFEEVLSEITFNFKSARKLYYLINNTGRHIDLSELDTSHYTRNFFFLYEDRYHQPTGIINFNPIFFFLENEIYIFFLFICLISFILSFIYYRKSQLKKEISKLRNKEIIVNKEFVIFLFFLNLPLLFLILGSSFTYNSIQLFIILIVLIVLNTIYIFFYLNVFLKTDRKLDFLNTELERHFLLLNDKFNKERDKQTKFYYYNLINSTYSITEKKANLSKDFFKDMSKQKFTSNIDLINREKIYRKRKKEIKKKLNIKRFYFLVFYTISFILSIIIFSHIFVINIFINLKKNISIAFFDLQFNIHRYIIKGSKFSMSEIIMQMDYGDKLIRNCKEVSEKNKLRDYSWKIKLITSFKDRFYLRKEKNFFSILNFIIKIFKVPYEFIKFCYSVYEEAEDIMTFRAYKEGLKIESMYYLYIREYDAQAKRIDRNYYELKNESIEEYDLLMDELRDEDMISDFDSGNELNYKYNVHNSIYDTSEDIHKDEIAYDLFMSSERLRITLSKDCPYDHSINLAYKNLEDRYYNKGKEYNLENEINK